MTGVIEAGWLDAVAQDVVEDAHDAFFWGAAFALAQVQAMNAGAIDAMTREIQDRIRAREARSDT